MISDETLLLYYYDDGLTTDERREVESALLADADLSRKYQEYCRQLETFRQARDVEAPEHSRKRWHDALDRAARVEEQKSAKSPRSFHLGSFAWGGAIAATLALVIGIYFSGKPDAVIPVAEPVVSAVEQPLSIIPAAFTRGLELHIRDSQSELSQLPLAAADNKNDLLLQIIQQNRVFERAADSNNAPDVARLLRAFEPILMRLASDDIAPEDAEALRAQLSFELQVMLTKLQRRTSDDKQTI